MWLPASDTQHSAVAKTKVAVYWASEALKQTEILFRKSVSEEAFWKLVFFMSRQLKANLNSQSRILWISPSVCPWSPPPRRCLRKSRNISEVRRRWCGRAARRRRSWCKLCPSPWWEALFLTEPRAAGPEKAAKSYRWGGKPAKLNRKDERKEELYAQRSQAAPMIWTLRMRARPCFSLTLSCWDMRLAQQTGVSKPPVLMRIKK